MLVTLSMMHCEWFTLLWVFPGCEGTAQHTSDWLWSLFTWVMWPPGATSCFQNVSKSLDPVLQCRGRGGTTALDGCFVQGGSGGGASSTTTANHREPRGRGGGASGFGDCTHMIILDKKPKTVKMTGLNEARWSLLNANTHTHPPTNTHTPHPIF